MFNSSNSFSTFHRPNTAQHCLLCYIVLAAMQVDGISAFNFSKLKSRGASVAYIALHRSSAICICFCWSSLGLLITYYKISIFLFFIYPNTQPNSTQITSLFVFSSRENNIFKKLFVYFRDYDFYVDFRTKKLMWLPLVTCEIGTR